MQQLAVHPYASSDGAGWQRGLQLAGLVVGMPEAKIAQPPLFHHHKAISRRQADEQVAFLRHVTSSTEVPHQTRSFPGGLRLFRVLL
jgi:hypothetical protein